MSLLKKIGGAIGSIARGISPVAGSIPGVGAIVGAAGMLGARSRLAGLSAMPSAAMMGGPALGPALGGIGRALGLGGALGTAGAVVVRGAGTAMRAANVWCRRNPVWCVSVGGLPAVADMITSGQLPAPRRRRGRGLTSRDLRGFRRTVRLIRATAGSVGLRGRTRGRPGTSSTMITQN